MSSIAALELASRRPFRRALLLGLSVVTLALGACGEEKVSTTAVEEGIGIASPALAIVHSDYATSRVSLYRPADGRLVDACTGSTSTDPGLVQPLSSDLILPTQQVGGELVLIDSSSSVVTFLDPSTCAARGQVSVSTGGFKAYPHDFVTVSAHKAYVTRSALNAKATVEAGDFDDGDDLLIVDPTALTVTGRIGLSAVAAPGPLGEATQARPDRAVLVGTRVYVTLSSADAKFSAWGQGRVAIVDTATDTVTGTLALPGQKNCSGLNYVVATKRLYVSCGGAYTEDQVAEAALVEIDVSTATPVIKQTIRATQLDGQPINFAYTAELGDAAFVGTLGTIGNAMFGTVDAPDGFFRVSLTTGDVKPVAEGTAYDLGSAAVDKATGRVFLPDADAATPRIRVFTADGEPATAADFDSNPSAHLPPRGLAWY
ncbi:MAG TPA: hypothetical protein VHU40_19850 [Polyangia bacterium]|nr:hypothetical protein [Polyangia bacterium]